ncbi:WXG100 family type VII secretion target [Micromonospora sp. NPDC092111]|uniref:WXG100 family type VII secretion target n=1 Tax=Micromonospora sp. NPDC092111 TaxID=3364289 RepID=UPI0037FD9F08
MADDDGTAGSGNPYQQETSQNTRTDWLADQKPVDVDLDGLVDYGKNMVTIQENLQSHGGRLSQLGQLPQSAWDGNALPEGTYIRGQMTLNYGEFQQYLTHLGTALTNIGMAAQTVADAYSSTDGWSAASLDAVRFAFGEANAPRPPGLPPFISGKTWWDQYFEAMSSGQNNTAPTPEQFVDQGQPTVNPDGSMTFTAIGPNGVVRTITQRTLPGGAGTVTVTTTTDANGKVLSSSSSRSATVISGNSTVVTTTTTDGDGKRTGGSRETTSYGSDGGRTVTSEQLDADGQPTSKKVDEQHADGTRTLTTTDGKGNVTQELHIGEDTAGVETSELTNSPTKQALDEIKRHDYGI